MDAGKLRALTNFVNAINIGPCIESLKQLYDGSHFFEMMTILNGSKPQQVSDHPIQRYRQILNFLEDFYNTDLKFHIDCSRIVNTADEAELAKVTALMLCASVQGDEEKVKLFVDQITKLDLTSQNEIKDIIEFVLNMEGSTNQLHKNFAEVLQRRESQSLTDENLQEMLEQIDVRGDSVSSEAPSEASTIKTPVEPASPFQRVYQASPLSPIKVLLTSPHMANKINLRKMHQRIRKLETQTASDRAFRDDLEAEVAEKNKTITELESQLRDLNNRLLSTKELQDKVDELQAKQEEYERAEVHLQKMKLKLSELGSIKEDHSRLNKENKEFAAETSKLRSSISKYQRLKGEYEAAQKELRQSHREVAELEASVQQLTKDISTYEGRCAEANEMLNQSQQIYKEKILRLEEELGAKTTSDQLGESLGVISEKRISELEAELNELRSTWTEPPAHQALKDELAQMSWDNDKSKDKIKSLEMLLNQERWASNEKLSALRSEVVSIRKESESVSKDLQGKLEDSQQLNVTLRAELERTKSDLEKERLNCAEKVRLLEAEKDTLLQSLRAESDTIRSLTERHHLESQSWEKTRQDLKESIKKLRDVQAQERSASQEKIASLENETSTLRVNLERTEAAKEALRASLDAQREELLYEKDKTGRETNEKQTELLQLLQKSRKDVAEAQLGIQSLREEAARKAEEERTESERRVSDLAQTHQDEVNSLEKARDELKKELEHSEETRMVEKIKTEQKTADLESKCESLTVHLERAKKENATLKNSLVSDKQEMFAERDKLVKEMEAREDNLRQELEDARKSLNQAKSEGISQQECHRRELRELKDEGERMVKDLKEAYQAEVVRLQQAIRDQKAVTEKEGMAWKKEQEQIERKCSDLERRIESLDEDLKRERSEKASLEASLKEQKDKMLNNLQNMEVASQEKEDQLRRDLMGSKQALSKAQTEMNILQENQRTQQAELTEELQQKAHDLLAKESEAQAAKEAWTERETNLVAEVESLRESLSTAELARSKLEESLQEAQDRMGIKQEQWQIVKERMEGEAQQLATVVEEQVGRIHKLQDDLDQLLAEKATVDMHCLQAKEDFHSQIGQKEATISQLKAELDSTREETQAHNKGQQEKIEKMRGEMERENKTALERMEAKQKTHEAEVEKLKTSASETERKLQERVSSSVRRVGELSEYLSEAMAMAEERGAKLDVIMAEKTGLESRLLGEKSSMELKMSGVTTESERLLQERARLVEDLSKQLKDARATSERNDVKLQNAVKEKTVLESRLVEEKAELLDGLSSLERHIEEERKTMEEAKIKWQSENDDLKQQVEDLQKQQELFQKRIQTAGTDCSDLQKTVEENKALELRLQEEKSSLESKIAELDGQIAEHRKTSEEEMEQLRGENENLKIQVDCLEKQRESLQESIQTTQKDHKSLDEAIREKMALESSLQETIKEKMTLESSLQEEKAALEARIAELDGCIAEQRHTSAEEMTAVAGENENLKVKVTELERKEKINLESIQMAEEDLAKAVAEKAGRVKQVDDLQSRLVGEKVDLEGKITELTERITGQETSSGEKMVALRGENDALKLQVAGLTKERESYQKSTEEEASERQSGYAKELEDLKLEKQNLVERMKRLMEVNRRYREGDRRATEAEGEVLKRYKNDVQAEFEQLKQRYEDELDKVRATEETRAVALEKELETVSSELEHTKGMLALKTEELSMKAELLSSATESLKSSKRETTKEITTLRQSLEKEIKVGNLQVKKLKTELLDVKTASCSLQRRIEEEAQKKLVSSEKKMAAEREELGAKIQKLEKEKEVLEKQRQGLQSKVQTMEKMAGPTKRTGTLNSSLTGNVSEVFSDSLTEDPPSHGHVSTDDSLTGTPSQKLGRNLSELRLDDLSVSPKMDLASSNGSNRSLRSNASSTRSRGRTTIEITMRSTTSETDLDKLPGMDRSATGSQLDLPEMVTRTLDELRASQSSLASSTLQAKSHHTTGRANFVIVDDCDEEPEFFAWEDRLQELHRRNTLCPAHMRTSYPVETQTCAPKEFVEEDLTTGSPRQSPRLKTRKRKTEMSDTDQAPLDKLRKATSHDTIPSIQRPTTSSLRKAVSHQEMPPPDAIPSSSKTNKGFLVSNAGSMGRILRSSDIRSTGKAQPPKPLKPEQKATAFEIGFSPKPSMRRRSMRHSFAKRALGKNSPKVNPEAGKENKAEAEPKPPAGTKKSRRRSIGKWLSK